MMVFDAVAFRLPSLAYTMIWIHTCVQDAKCEEPTWLNLIISGHHLSKKPIALVWRGVGTWY